VTVSASHSQSLLTLLCLRVTHADEATHVASVVFDQPFAQPKDVHGRGVGDGETGTLAVYALAMGPRRGWR